MLPKINPTKTESWKKLIEHKKRLDNLSIQDLFRLSEKNRFNEFHINFDGILLDYSKNKIDTASLNSLINFAEECELKKAIDSMFNGDFINETEKRAVLHPLLRFQKKTDYACKQEELYTKVESVRKKLKQFSTNVIDKKHLGFTGKSIIDVVNIGIGGSDLGPKFVSNALKNYKSRLNVHYISNIDASATKEVLKNLDPETTLFIIASKTFTTDETMTNAEIARCWFLEKIKDTNAIKNHFVAISSFPEKAQEFGIEKENIFELWDWVGGRFSLWGAVGLSICLAIGYNNFELLLEGANQMDRHFLNTPFNQNIPVITALIGIWNNNFWDYSSHAILSYDSNLNFFVPFLQQMIMESNGKGTDRNGEKINYKTNPIIWGEVGTDAQHAFFQQLHQGTTAVPTDFLVAKKASHKEKNSHTKLLSNFLAQTQALAFGNVNNKHIPSLHQVFEGNRPSNSIIYDELTPTILGKIITLYEHKVFVQGVLWNIFSFDQWGVELGKIISKSIYNDFNLNETSNFDDSTNGLMKHILKN